LRTRRDSSRGPDTPIVADDAPGGAGAILSGGLAVAGVVVGGVIVALVRRRRCSGGQRCSCRVIGCSGPRFRGRGSGVVPRITCCFPSQIVRSSWAWASACGTWGSRPSPASGSGVRDESVQASVHQWDGSSARGLAGVAGRGPGAARGGDAPGRYTVMSDVTAPFGERLPELRTAVPGPASRTLAVELAAVESRNITRIAEDGPIFWAEARGANVRDADGNTYVDLTGGFSVAAAGHGNPRVASAVAEQASRLAHGLGDVYPPDIKVRLLRTLAELATGELGVTILANSGAEAVEAALKTAVMRTGRPGILAFEGAYHGLTY